MRYQVIHSTYSTGMFTEFSAASDAEAIAERRASSDGGRIIYLVEMLPNNTVRAVDLALNEKENP